MLRSSLLWCTLGLASLVACGGKPMTAADPAPPAHGIQLATGAYTVPGGTEKYYCFATTLNQATSVAVNRFDVYPGSLVHHMAVFRTLEAEPEGFSECPLLIKTTWIPVFANGRSATPVNFATPDGSGFKLKSNDQVLVQLHLLNSTNAPITDKTFVNLTFAPNPDALVGAGIYAVGTMAVNIPAGAQGYQVKNDCNLDKDINIFAFFPHMHQIGTKITFEHGTSAANATVVYKKDPWVFGDQPMDPLKMTLKKGDYVRTTCTYNNNTTHAITFGESTNNEMCYMVMFIAPFDRLDGCVAGM